MSQKNKTEAADSKKSAAVAAPKKATAISSTGEETRKKPVVQAFLHSQILFKGITSDNLRESQHTGLKMLWVRGEGLLISYNGGEAIIPAAGVKLAIFEEKSSGRVVAS